MKSKKDIAIEKLNEKIDELIIAGKTKTKKYKQLTRLHFTLTRG